MKVDYMDKIYNYNDFIETNRENKKWLGYKVQVDDFMLTVNKVRILTDKTEIERMCKTIDNPKVMVSGEGVMLVSVLVEAVMNKHLVLSNPTYLRKWKRFA